MAWISTIGLEHDMPQQTRPKPLPPWEVGSVQRMITVTKSSTELFTGDKPVRLFTDGSKAGSKCGIAVVCLDAKDVEICPPRHRRATDDTGIYDCELHAIDLALKMVKQRNWQDCQLYSDSQAALRSLY